MATVQPDYISGANGAQAIGAAPESNGHAALTVAQARAVLRGWQAFPTPSADCPACGTPCALSIAGVDDEPAELRCYAGGRAQAVTAAVHAAIPLVAQRS